MKPGVEKIIRLQVANGIPLPKYLGDLLMYYVKNVRTVFIDEDSSVLSYWVNDKGQPLRKLLILFLILIYKR